MVHIFVESLHRQKRWFFCMNRYSRSPNRTSRKVSEDIVATSKITREDIYDVVVKASTKDEAITLITEFIRGLPEGVESLDRYGREEALDRILSDLDSYKDWDDDRKS